MAFTIGFTPVCFKSNCLRAVRIHEPVNASEDEILEIGLCARDRQGKVSDGVSNTTANRNMTLIKCPDDQSAVE
jgi:hypothetical protein